MTTPAPRVVGDNTVTPETSLYGAAAVGTAEQVLSLLAGGVDPNEWCDPWQRTPLHRACERDDRNTDMESVWIASLLIEYGHSLTATDERGDTPLHTAARANNAPVASLLCQGGADARVRNEDGHSALHVACTVGARETVEAILVSGSGDDNVDVIDTCGNTPLFAALGLYPGIAVASTNSCVECLLAHGADLHALNHAGITPLVHAVRCGNLSGVTTLCKRHVHANYHSCDATLAASSAMHAAVASGNIDIVTVLLRQGRARADGPLPPVTVRSGHPTREQRQQQQWLRPLAMCAQRPPSAERDAILNVLIGARADVNDVDPLLHGTLLHQCAREDNRSLTARLLCDDVQLDLLARQHTGIGVVGATAKEVASEREHWTLMRMIAVAEQRHCEVDALRRTVRALGEERDAIEALVKERQRQHTASGFRADRRRGGNDNDGDGDGDGDDDCGGKGGGGTSAATAVEIERCTTATWGETISKLVPWRWRA